MRSSRPLRFVLAAAAAVFACAQAIPATSSSFTGTTANGGNTATAAADWTAPTVAAAVLQKSEGGVVNKLHASETFYVYASVADSGNPSAGLGTVTASVANLATVSSATMSAGSWTVGGTGYNRRSALLTAKSSLSSATFTWSLSVSDAAANGPTIQAGSAVSSNVTLAPSSFLTTNVSGTAGKPDAGDTITFTYSSAPDPEALFAGWDGSSRTVAVAFADKSINGTTSDAFGITDAGGNVTPLGYLLTGGDYVTAGKTATFPGSTIVLSGSTLTVTLAATAVATDTRTDGANHAAQWSSFATMFDTFGNGSTAATITGTSRKQF